MNRFREHAGNKNRGRGALVLAAVLLALGSAPAFAANPNPTMPYASGDLLYVAYQNTPSGREYIVNLGSSSQILNAADVVNFPHVISTDLNSVVGTSAPNIWVAIFGIDRPATRDGIVSQGGPANDIQLDTSTITGAVNQIDGFGLGLKPYNDYAAPSNDANACAFSGNVRGSYQATLNGGGAEAGSLQATIAWKVEVRLSDASGVRISTPAKVKVFAAEQNYYSNPPLRSRRLLGFVTLNPSGTITYTPDADGDFVNDRVDNCPGVYNPDQTDADHDGRGAACDCNDSNAAVWSLPGEATGLNFSSATQLTWSPPTVLGGAAVQYDTFRGFATTGVPSYSCLAGALASPQYTDGSTPGSGQAYLYLARAKNSCGTGTVGAGTPGTPARTVPACP